MGIGYVLNQESLKVNNKRTPYLILFAQKFYVQPPHAI